MSVYMGMRCLRRPCKIPLVDCTTVKSTMVRLERLSSSAVTRRASGVSK